MRQQALLGLGRGWQAASELGRFSAVFLDDSDLHPRIRQRIELTRGLIAADAAATFRVESIGGTPCERLLSLVLLSIAVTMPARADEPISFEKQVRPLLKAHCFECHGEGAKLKGDLDLRIYTDETIASRDRQVFEKVLKNLQAHEMPPETKPQPSPAERDLITHWVSEFFFPCDCNHPDPGRVTIRRLNRAEYNNTIRDLVGVDFQPADDCPADDVGYGFGGT